MVEIIRELDFNFFIIKERRKEGEATFNGH